MLKLEALTSIPLNTNKGFLPMGGHLFQTSGYLNQPAFNGVVMPPSLTPPTLDRLEAVPKITSFKNVLFDTMNNVNGITNKPTELMQEAMAGGNVDIHDIAMANTKAELAITLSTTAMTKVIQAYEKLTQIQV
jgi:flagellar hook-basal body complex protein FliE